MSYSSEFLRARRENRRLNDGFLLLLHDLRLGHGDLGEPLLLLILQATYRDALVGSDWTSLKVAVFQFNIFIPTGRICEFRLLVIIIPLLFVI